jgi:hypothetical protein
MDTFDIQVNVADPVPPPVDNVVVTFTADEFCALANLMINVGGDTNTILRQMEAAIIRTWRAELGARRVVNITDAAYVEPLPADQFGTPHPLYS